MVANKKKSSAIDLQLREFEAKLRREMLKQRLDALRQHEEHPDGALPTIHVSLGQLAASNPAHHRPQAHGD
jgi:hypothetical protein